MWEWAIASGSVQQTCFKWSTMMDHRRRLLALGACWAFMQPLRAGRQMQRMDLNPLLQP